VPHRYRFPDLQEAQATLPPAQFERLNAAVRWAEDSERAADILNRPHFFPEELSWEAFALFLYCGKIYE
jgi:hypothetical protein